MAATKVNFTKNHVRYYVDVERGRSYENLSTQKFSLRKFYNTKISRFTVIGSLCGIDLAQGLLQDLLEGDAGASSYSLVFRYFYVSFWRSMDGKLGLGTEKTLGFPRSE